MHHAPVSTDADQEREEPAEQGVESLAFDQASERLRAAHLYNRQVEARALFAPFFSVTAAVAALLTAWAMIHSVRIELVVGWVALVVAANFFSCRRAMATAAMGTSRTARSGARTVAIGEAV